MAIKARAEITLAGVSDGAKGDTGATGAAGADGKMLYGTCSTAAATAAKVATATGFKLVSGTSVSIKFTYANTAASPTLNINSLGAKAVYVNGTRYAYWAAGSTVTFVYDGTQFQVCSVPVYANTVTVGNPGSKNVYIDSDSVDIRSASTTMASFSMPTSGNAYLTAVNNLMLAAGTSSKPKGVYFSVPPASDGTESDMGFGLVFSGTGANTAHAYFATADGSGNMTDWVVAKGTSGIWTYQKWASGKAECWGMHSLDATVDIEWLSPLYRSHTGLVNISFPFTFKNVPTLMRVAIPRASDNGDGLLVMSYSNTTTSKTGSIFLGRGGAADTTQKVYIGHYALGRWK